MTTDEKDELLRDFTSAAHQTIRFTGLFRELSNDEWDALSERLGRAGLSYVEALCDEELTRIEDAKELSRLRREMESHSLGDKPTSMAADKLRRLIELETIESERKRHAD